MKINNPYLPHKEHFCFGCSPKNPIGLHLNFERDGDRVLCQWQPEANYQGFHQVLHGGILATLLDEIAGWVVQAVVGTAGVTSEMNVKYLKPVYVHDGPLQLEAAVSNRRGRLVDIDTKLSNALGVLCTQASVTYYLFSPEVAKKKFNYPGADAFLPPDVDKDEYL
jgi:uncharacterized protein (TIGR00369 family)